VECKDKCNTLGNWDDLKIIQKIADQHTGKARNQGTTENIHTGHGTHTSENTNVKVQSTTDLTLELALSAS
jgi:hypothetical protein